MSDYISKSALIKAIDEQVQGWGKQGIVPSLFSAIAIVQNQPTLDEKEIIRKTVERIVERVENARQKYQRLVKEQGEKEDEAMNIHFRGVMNIVKEVGGLNESN